ncbi:MAG: hypothetical protein V4690_03220 [Patescibacteria group bacterium]
MSLDTFDIDLHSVELAGEVDSHPNFQAMLLSLDSRGHKFGSSFEDMKELLKYRIYPLGSEKLSALMQAIKTDTPMTEFMNLGRMSEAKCHECGVYVGLETDGLVMRASGSCLCPPEGPIEFELNVPSGVMIYTDDLRPLFDIVGSFDINTRLGTIKHSQVMAKIGCAQGYVGNSCPDVYQTSDTAFSIVGVATDDVTYEPIDEPLGERMDQIVTDLWWYSFVDADEFMRRGGEERSRVSRLKVRPGVYKFSHNLRTSKDEFKTFVFTTVTWVREPDPVKDYLGEIAQVNFTAGQVIAHKLAKWPTLYRGEDAVMSAANHIFCVIGGGGDWHPNGFVQYDPDMEEGMSEVEIPVFDKPYRWYPLSEYSAVVIAAGLSEERDVIHLNPTFLALARNVLQCIVKHRSLPMRDGDTNNDHILAKKCLDKLDEMYG